MQWVLCRYWCERPPRELPARCCFRRRRLRSALLIPTVRQLQHLVFFSAERSLRLRGSRECGTNAWETCVLLSSIFDYLFKEVGTELVTFSRIHMFLFYVAFVPCVAIHESPSIATEGTQSTKMSLVAATLR